MPRSKTLKLFLIDGELSGWIKSLKELLETIKPFNFSHTF